MEVDSEHAFCTNGHFLSQSSGRDRIVYRLAIRKIVEGQPNLFLASTEIVLLSVSAKAGSVTLLINLK
jgi:hypothetical protein